MISDYYGNWVERHKHETDAGQWWITSNDVPSEGPFDTEEEIDAILWERALDGDALPSPP